ncbi:hypothetical protein [Paracidovorax citrulli]|uniref:hypothetical protein n=1 Tax=Paracidovorax citrulli TaxID=80869 RepID=UPI00031102E7|nr:hypothetical protein [Paracidovorax citrulli]QCX11264.1 hypothetical protein APS58_2445 [Paracidovorax citrulli]UEG45765.1 hypothetical protein LKW27_19290 [Paracidovorax citrulli]UMT94977.1 hypothetical protein FRC97_08150 [Paracidovorax citrulli]
MTPADILAEIDANFEKGQRRKFLPGLLVAFIDFFHELDAVGGKFASLNDFYAQHPLVLTGRGGSGVNTLTVLRDKDRPTGVGTQLSIRRAYDQIQAWFHAQKRYDYPSSAPHSTQAWKDYSHWLEALLAFDEPTLKQLKEDAKAYVIAKLPEHKVDSALVKRAPPVFLLFLQNFDLTKHKGELTGAAYQGAVFGYLRADAAHLQVDVAKVRTGSKRVGRIGDIDARDGELLVLSAEVKQYKLELTDVPSFAQFSSQVNDQSALGLVVALDFEEGAREALRELQLEPVSIDDLIERVRLWDSLKQAIAVQALLYYVHYIEKSSALYMRLRTFLDGLEADEMIAAEPEAEPPQLDVDP